MVMMAYCRIGEHDRPHAAEDGVGHGGQGEDDAVEVGHVLG
jgi:hypothetical protein